MRGNIEFEAESAAEMGVLLYAEGESWCKRQCVDKSWWKWICQKNLRGNASKIKLRFLLRSDAYVGRLIFSVLVSFCECL